MKSLNSFVSILFYKGEKRTKHKNFFFSQDKNHSTKGDMDANNYEDWNEWVEDDESVNSSEVPCPLCGSVVVGGRAEKIFEHCKGAHKFDLSTIRADWKLDDYGWIRLVNWLRKNAKASAEQCITSLGDAFGVTGPDHPLFSDDSNLIPVIPSDPLLALLSDDDDDDFDGASDKMVADDDDSNMAICGEEVLKLKQRLMELEEENASLKQTISRIFGEESEILPQKNTDDDDDDSDEEKMTSSNETSKRKNENRAKTDSVEGDGYFDSYARMGIHEDMLSDRVRTGAYEEWTRRAGRSGYLTGKRVIDVGAGTGILSIFAAQEGASRVYAIEASSTAKIARKMIASNKVEDKITIVNALAESDTAKEMITEKVDVIISEWMGYALLFENMLDSVLYARDTWLAEGGAVQPSHAIMYVTAMEETEGFTERSKFFDTPQYGVNLSETKTPAFAEADVRVIDTKTVASKACVLREIDILTVKRGTTEDLRLPYELTLDRDVTAVHALCVYFDVDFRTPGIETVKLSTAPETEPTHWKQTVLMFEKPFADLKAGTVLAGSLHFVVCSSGPHDVDIHATMTVKSVPDGAPKPPTHEIEQLFHV